MLARVRRRAPALARSAGRLTADAVLAIFYAVGAAAGALTVAVLAIVAAVRLGWTDTRKRGGHGPA